MGGEDMDKEEKVIDIGRRYSSEINDINNILHHLERGRYSEKSRARMDGSISTQVENLKTLLDDLLNKIEYNKPSKKEILGAELRDKKI